MLDRRTDSAAGFTLIELVVTIAIFSLLVALTVPAMRTWVANTKVRAVADALQNGIRLAQSESLRRSRQVVFALTNNANPAAGPGTFAANATGTYWAVQTVPAIAGEAALVIQTGVLTSAGSTITIAAQQNQKELCFNSMGRLVANTATGVPGGTCTTPVATVNGVAAPIFTYLVSGNGGAQMQVEVGLGGHLHLCDPLQTLSSANPYGC